MPAPPLDPDIPPAAALPKLSDVLDGVDDAREWDSLRDGISDTAARRRSRRTVKIPNDSIPQQAAPPQAAAPDELTSSSDWHRATATEVQGVRADGESVVMIRPIAILSIEGSDIPMPPLPSLPPMPPPSDPPAEAMVQAPRSKKPPPPVRVQIDDSIEEIEPLSEPHPVTEFSAKAVDPAPLPRAPEEVTAPRLAVSDAAEALEIAVADTFESDAPARHSQPSLKKPPPPPKRAMSGEQQAVSPPTSQVAPVVHVSPVPPVPPAQPPASLPSPPSGAIVDSAQRKRTKAWWEDLFGDDYIRTMDRLDANSIRREADFIEDALGVEKGAVVLDLCCGAGQHAVELASRGYSVVGYDLSLAMLARAADEAQDRAQKLNFLQGDMREMAFEEMFDGVYCWSTSFGYFEEEKNVDVLLRIHRSLRQGGMLLLDVVNRDFVSGRSPSLVWFEGDGCVCMDDMHLDFFTSRLQVKRTAMFEDGRARELEYSIRLYALHELGKMLHDCGFRVVQVTGHPAHPGVYFGSESPRTIVLAERS